MTEPAQRPERVRLGWISLDLRRRTAVLYASKLAALAGLHPYAPQDELRGELLRALGAEPGFVSREERARGELEALPEDRRLRLEAAVATRHASADAVQATLAATLHDNPGLSADAADAVRSALYTEHGRQQEDAVRAGAARALDAPVEVNAAFRVSREPVLRLARAGGGGEGGFAVYLGGRLDGTAGNKVVEVKTRQRRLLGVPEYERVQVHAYMAITGTRVATVAESHNGQTAVHDVHFDDALWARVLGAVAAFFDTTLPRVAGEEDAA